MTTNIQCGPLQADPSNYSKHIRLMMIKTERVPVGWRKTYADVLRDLLARDCASRSNLVLSGPSVEAGEISFSVSKDDACVAGILRKTAARLRGQSGVRCAGTHARDWTQATPVVRGVLCAPRTGR